MRWHGQSLISFRHTSPCAGGLLMWASASAQTGCLWFLPQPLIWWLTPFVGGALHPSSGSLVWRRVKVCRTGCPVPFSRSCMLVSSLTLKCSIRRREISARTKTKTVNNIPVSNSIIGNCLDMRIKKKSRKTPSFLIQTTWWMVGPIT